MKKLTDLEWLDNRGFAIVKHLQEDYTEGEFILARIILEDNKIILYEELLSSKFKHRLMKRYQQELNTNTEIVMDIMETLKGLTIKELESLKPSYYNNAIDIRIAELKAKKEKNATKIIRGTEKTNKTSSRKRNIQA